MKIVSWNVAGFRACQKKGFEEFFKRIDADIVCLQETKIIDSELTFRPNGYEIFLNPAEKKGYSGVMIYSKKKPLNVKYGMGILEHDHEGRMITLEFEDFYLISVYVPNSQRGLLRLSYRMQWEEDFQKYISNLEKKKPVIYCGDLNVAHEEIDLANPKENVRNAGFTIEERNAFTKTLSLGYIDTYRYLNPTKVIYTWWSYITHARERNIGWRIDYFIVSKKIIDRVIDSKVLNGVMGSDHCPIVLEIK